MATLKEDVKLYIVQSLACFDTPSEVAEAVKEDFGIVVTRMQCSAYDPTTVTGLRLGQKWVDIFNAARKEFLEEKTTIAIANKAYRLRELQKSHLYLKSKKNYVASNQVLEQAAKEVGEFHVNRNRELPKAPGDEGNAAPKPEYVLKPDEDAPAKPIL